MAWLYTNFFATSDLQKQTKPPQFIAAYKYCIILSIWGHSKSEYLLRLLNEVTFLNISQKPTFEPN